MLSLEPATITDRRYPLLFQTGETAFGKPHRGRPASAQFLHGLWVRICAAARRRTPRCDSTSRRWATRRWARWRYPHRASAMELPQAPLAHHWQDSTHIAEPGRDRGDPAPPQVRLEASGFHGTEPDENRWNIDYGGIDSWAARLSVYPTANWAAQVSLGRLAHPERQEPGDVLRTTASLEYSSRSAAAPVGPPA